LAPRRPDQPGAPPLPDEDAVELELPVALDGLRLAMRARPTRPLVEPGAPATFEVEVRRGGAPVAGAEVALMVVDEAVLALSSRTHADPLGRFHRGREEGTWQASTLPLIEDAGDDLAGAPGIARYSLDTDGSRGYGVGSGRGGMRGRASAVPSVSIGAAGPAPIRLDFRPDAAFSPRLRTGPDGKAQLTVDMPDSLTRYRVIALATADTRYFGKAESTIVTQRKINARTVAPRFLTQGDALALPIVVQNLDARPRTVDVAVRAANLVATGPTGRRVTIPAGQRAEVRFAFAARARGRAVIQTIVASGGAVDASSVALPVYEPATTEAFATYGVVDGDAPQFEQLAVPADLFPEVGGVEVELASTELQSLTDAYWYLYAYPYECAEQRSARMIATAALGPLLEAFAAPGRPARAEIEATIARDVRLLGREQHADGGWGYFEGTRSDPFVTLQVLTALAAHRATDGTVKRAAAFAEREAAALLAGLERAVRTGPPGRPDRGELAYRIGLAAHALAALAGTGADVRARAERLHAAATALAAYPVDAKARLLALVARLPRAAAMRARLLGDLVAATRETASSAAVAAGFEARERRLLASSTRTSALVLDALMREAPEHPLVTKLVRGVLDARRAGRWGSTQENLVALTALRRYFDRHEKVVPAFTGRVWLGGAAYAEREFTGRDGARGAARVGWAQLSPGTAHDVAIARAGEGRMYYRVGITYAPRQTDLPALDAGFVVRRAYAAIDDPGDVTRTADGRWKIRLGARVQVTVEASATVARHGVAIVDPLPAGLEAVNDALATSERAVRGPGGAAWDHVALRDNRSEAFAMELLPGRHQLSYTARATTPGTFLAAPAKAEEMYSPETFGRSIGSTVVIE
ncbi:MAG TPA: alpha-2-macroglobulin family protein, partial [Kofleriaceae bacterium]|nr:alpha-2-macroglobulin family protein [Kofleriaceae bacterium]